MCNIDPKTGDVRFFQEVKFPEIDEIFNISNTFYDKEAGKLIVVGQLLLEKRGKDFFNALGVLVFDSKGKMISSQKIMFPEFEIEEPKDFNFKNKKLIAHAIGKLSNGNYFIACENKAEGAPYTSEYFYSASPVVASAQSTATVASAAIPYKKNIFFSTVGFSYFELNPSLVVVKSSLKIVETFNKKNNLVTYEGFSKDGKNVVYSELDKERKSISVIDFNSADKYGSKELEGDAYDFRLAEKGYKKKDIFFCKIIDDRVVIVRKRSESESFTLTSKSIR